jgi:hypothetical protein
MALPCSMFISRLRLRGNWLFVLLVFPGLPYLAACGSGYHAGTVSTSVAALPGEDLAGPCTYDLTLSSPQAQQAGVLVVFERGDSAYLYADPAVQGMAAKLNLAMVYAHQCNAISTGDLQPDAAQGPGRALLLALTQFSQSTGHAELATAKVCERLPEPGCGGDYAGGGFVHDQSGEHCDRRSGGTGSDADPGERDRRHCRNG